MENNNFFTKPIKTHQLSKGFADMCLELHFKNFDELLAWPVSHLVKLNGFSYHHYHELWKYMDKNNFTKRIRH